MNSVSEELTYPHGLKLDSLRSLPTVVEGWWGWYVAAEACNVIKNVASAVAAGAAAYAVAAAVTRDGADLMVPTLLVLGATLVRSVALWQEAYTTHDIAFRALARIRNWIYAAFARIAPGGVAGRRTGDLVSATTKDSEALEIFLAHSSVYMIGRWISTPIIVGGLALISWPVALSTLPFLAAAWITPLVARRAAREQGRRAKAVLTEMGADMQENVGAVREITAFGLLGARLGRLTEQHRRLWKAQFAATARAGMESAMGGVISSLLIVAATAVGVREVQAGRLDIAWLPVVAAVAGAGVAGIAEWVTTTRHYGNTSAAARRIEEILDAPDPLPLHEPDHGAAPEAPAGETSPELRAEGVTYSWPGAPAPAVREADLMIGAGETIALAGRSGAGKSTLGQLLARWYDPDEGRILLGGCDLRTIAPSERARLISLVPQEPYIFAESVRENLLLAAPEGAEDGQLWEALERTRAAEVVRRLPEGLDTVLADRGRSLSGGERQRLALARVALLRPQVLILDEAVSQLDVANEVALRSSLSGVATTTVIIAHRLSTLLTTERIVVMDGGRIAGDGSHAGLLETCPAYSRLVGPQLASAR